MIGTLGTHTVVQVGFIVRDLEKAKRDFAAFLGTPVPENCDGGRYEITKTTVDGTPLTPTAPWPFSTREAACRSS